MIVFPAIDIQSGKVVRLKQGHFDQVSHYSADPVAVAREWVAQGASWLHVVDLDGARLGKIGNYATITRIAREVPVPIQTGGGIRSEEDIERYLADGVQRVILSTKIIDNRAFLKTLLSRWPEKIAVSLDCARGMVARRGWTQTTDIKAVDLARELADLGLRYLVYTDIARDGMLAGPDIEGLKAILQAVPIKVIASGGISGIEDIDRLCALSAPNLLGVITGKALYEGKLDLKQALKLCSQNA